MFPADLLFMTDLTRLYIGGNRLVAVPREIGRLDKLELLYLGGNKITSIPDTIGNLRKLSVLYLGDNRLSSIPETVCKLLALRTLNLHNNKLSFLPSGLIKMVRFSFVLCCVSRQTLARSRHGVACCEHLFFLSSFSRQLSFHAVVRSFV